MDNYCEHIHADCEYLIVCKDHIDSSSCLRELFGDDVLSRPEYTPEAIIKRLIYFKNKNEVK